jgi:hypothetical protein
MIIGLASILVGINIAYGADEDFEVDHKDHMKFFKSKKDTASLDVNNDGLTDFYAKGYFNKTTDKVFHVDFKIQDCLTHGSTYSDARTKIGFTSIDFPFIWHTNDFKAWNSWFTSKKNPDLDKQIDLVTITNPIDIAIGNVPIHFPTRGDNVIQQSLNDKSSSFQHFNKIKQLDGQSGWEGSISFTAPVGNYYFWTVFPAGGDPNQDQGCDTTAGIQIPITVR